jgi:hypothetical protein
MGNPHNYVITQPHGHQKLAQAKDMTPCNSDVTAAFRKSRILTKEPETLREKFANFFMLNPLRLNPLFLLDRP